MPRKLNTSKADLDRMELARREANAAIAEVRQLQNAGKGGKAMREAVRAREHYIRETMQAIVTPRDGVLKQLENL
jgi:hypothetical protein